MERPFLSCLLLWSEVSSKLCGKICCLWAFFLILTPKSLQGRQMASKKAVFNKCMSFGAKIPHEDDHLLCPLCVGEDRDASRYQGCAQFAPKVRHGRSSGLNISLWEKAFPGAASNNGPSVIGIQRDGSETSFSSGTANCLGKVLQSTSELEKPCLKSSRLPSSYHEIAVLVWPSFRPPVETVVHQLVTCAEQNLSPVAF